MIRAGKRGFAFAALLVMAAAAFAALGVWQVERRAWKLDLIAAVDARVHAPAIAAPGPGDWAGLTAARDGYRHVQVEGDWMPGDTLVHALTERGAGYWVLTPLRTGGGWTVLVNRGFVPAAQARAGGLFGAKADGPLGAAQVTGLLRPTEAGGVLMGRNDPHGDSWFSRDVPAIAGARGLADLAPYFIDAAAGPDPLALPVGGLTVVEFRNSHLVYAVTWFGLAALSLVGVAVVLRAAPVPPAGRGGQPASNSRPAVSSMRPRQASASSHGGGMPPTP